MIEKRLLKLSLGSSFLNNNDSSDPINDNKANLEEESKRAHYRDLNIQAEKQYNDSINLLFQQVSKIKRDFAFKNGLITTDNDKDKDKNFTNLDDILNDDNYDSLDDENVDILSNVNNIEKVVKQTIFSEQIKQAEEDHSALQYSALFAFYAKSLGFLLIWPIKIFRNRIMLNGWPTNQGEFSLSKLLSLCIDFLHKSDFKTLYGGLASVGLVSCINEVSSVISDKISKRLSRFLFENKIITDTVKLSLFQILFSLFLEMGFVLATLPLIEYSLLTGSGVITINKFSKLLPSFKFYKKILSMNYFKSNFKRFGIITLWSNYESFIRAMGNEYLLFKINESTFYTDYDKGPGNRKFTKMPWNAVKGYSGLGYDRKILSDELLYDISVPYWQHNLFPQKDCILAHFIFLVNLYSKDYVYEVEEVPKTTLYLYSQVLRGSGDSPISFSDDDNDNDNNNNNLTDLNATFHESGDGNVVTATDTIIPNLVLNVEDHDMYLNQERPNNNMPHTNAGANAIAADNSIINNNNGPNHFDPTFSPLLPPSAPALRNDMPEQVETVDGAMTIPNTLYDDDYLEYLALANPDNTNEDDTFFSTPRHNTQLYHTRLQHASARLHPDRDTGPIIEVPTDRFDPLNRSSLMPSKGSLRALSLVSVANNLYIDSTVSFLTDYILGGIEYRVTMMNGARSMFLPKFTFAEPNIGSQVMLKIGIASIEWTFSWCWYEICFWANRAFIKTKFWSDQS